ncbi:MAG: hypothetical protein ACI4J5_08500 [Oscillospiraceae bacterium]
MTEKVMTMERKAFSTIIIILTALCLLGFILTASAQFLPAALIIGISSAVSLKRYKKATPKKKDIVLRIISVLIVLMFIFSMPPLGLSSSMLWQYPFQKSFVGMYKNIKEPDWFPDFRDDVISDHRFDYLPGIMQGTGHFSVRFVTSPEHAAEYAEKYSRQAKWTIAYKDISFTDMQDDHPDIFADREFWESSPDAAVYILDGVADRNHPHSSAVIIDVQTGKIQLSQLG